MRNIHSKRSPEMTSTGLQAMATMAGFIFFGLGWAMAEQAAMTDPISGTVGIGLAHSPASPYSRSVYHDSEYSESRSDSEFFSRRGEQRIDSGDARAPDERAKVRQRYGQPRIGLGDAPRRSPR
jgi:hypothetical protein